jgi:glycosyltransferase involved in cell wall biosynthesis
MKKKLIIILHFYNEDNTVEIILKKLVSLKLYNNLQKELIIIDDYSADGSIDILKKYTKKYSFIKTIYKKKNKGKGESQKLAKRKVSGDYVIIQDADLEYNPTDINKLLKIANL